MPTVASKKALTLAPQSAFEGTELVFGIVAPLGTDVERFEQDLRDCLAQFRYEIAVTRVTDFLKLLDPDLPTAPEATRIDRFIAAGNSLRQKTKRNDILALFAASNIRKARTGRAPGRRAFIIRTLKRPEEVELLRRTYGHGFFLFGIFARADERREHLLAKKRLAPEMAANLMDRDAEEEEDASHGQRTRRTFALSDAFVREGDRGGLERIIDGIFGCPFITPTQDEYAMFLAYASSLRSGDLSRQVGAVIVSATGDVMATGANDVPTAGGGLYWPGPHDHRDHARGFDANEQIRNEAIKEIVGRLTESSEDQTSLLDKRKRLTGTILLDLTEFGRAVHAEMEALLSCARSGASTRGATLYTTTFPCHNCAKHLIAAGVSRVVFIEPYAKSRALELHSDALTLEQPEQRKVMLEPFVGLGPRRFVDLYSIALGTGYPVQRKTDEGTVIEWTRQRATPRVPMLPNSYVEREQNANRDLLAATRSLRER